MEEGHRIGKFNILSVNVILFRGNQKNIRVGLLGRNNADFGLFTKKSSDFRTISGKRNFSSSTDVPKKPFCLCLRSKTSKMGKGHIE